VRDRAAGAALSRTRSEVSMNSEARRAIEAILMVADSPIEPQLLAQITEVPVAEVERICSELAAEYESTERGFVLARVAGGYRYQSHPEMAPYVERFVLDGQSARMSAAALETLAIVAYKQPISRAQIASIRGVNVDGVIRTLQARGYVDEVGRDPGPGNAIMYGTTPAFLEKLGLDTIDQLPPLGAFVPGAEVVEQLERTLRVEPVDTAGTNGSGNGTAEVAATNGNGTGPHAEADEPSDPDEPVEADDVVTVETSDVAEAALDATDAVLDATEAAPDGAEVSAADESAAVDERVLDDEG
jgi:segregation and condensation protein B